VVEPAQRVDQRLQIGPVTSSGCLTKLIYSIPLIKENKTGYPFDSADPKM
jgi:hypothetical protein